MYYMVCMYVYAHCYNLPVPWEWLEVYTFPYLLVDWTSLELSCPTMPLDGDPAQYRRDCHSSMIAASQDTFVKGK